MFVSVNDKPVFFEKRAFFIQIALEPQEILQSLRKCYQSKDTVPENLSCGQLFYQSPDSLRARAPQSQDLDQPVTVINTLRFIV